MSMSLPTRLRVAATTLALAMLAAVPAAAKERPGTGRTPAFTCFTTTITDQGHTRQSKIFRKSGNPAADRRAQRVVRITRFLDEDGPHHERPAYVVVKMYGVGFAMQFYELYEPLPEVCSQPPDA